MQVWPELSPGARTWTRASRCLTFLEVCSDQGKSYQVQQVRAQVRGMLREGSHCRSSRSRIAGRRVESTTLHRMDMFVFSSLQHAPVRSRNRKHNQK